MNKLMKVFIINGYGGSGKALPNDTVIPTPNGPRTVKEIQVGDFLFDRWGEPTKVLGVFPQGEQDAYEISFKDGRKTICSIDHLWNIHKKSWHRASSKNKFIPYSTRQILEEGIKIDDIQGYRFEIQCSKAVKYFEQKLNIHPYVFGCFLGDGCCLERILTLSSNDIEIIERINNLLGNNGYGKISNNNYSWQFYCPEKQYNINNVEKKYFQTREFFKDYLDYICKYSYEKSIPPIYKYSSIEQRLELIKGLMDTDGSIDSKGRLTFTSTSIKLINDVKEILGSLGYVSTIYEDTRDKYTNNKCYQLHINIDNKEKEKLFHLPRKKNIAKNLPVSQFNYDRTKIVNIKPLNIKIPMTCFLVDNEEHLFLANDFIVTHNTTFEKMVMTHSKGQGHITSMVEIVKHYAEQMGWEGTKEDKDRKFLSDLKLALAEWADIPMQYVINRVQLFEELNDTTYCFVDAREPADIDKLKELLDKDFDVRTVLVDRNISREYGNIADDGVMNYKYDITIMNTGTLKDLEKCAISFVKEEGI